MAALSNQSEVAVRAPAAPAKPPATASPHELSAHPYIGILGVFLGASLATMNGRLLSLGLADLRGALGIDADTAAWIPTVLDM
jgi:MFS transporter, DHA2 family, multidrug resistance protein